LVGAPRLRQRTFPDTDAAAGLRLQTYLAVPLIDEHGTVQGTLCGASSRRVPLGPEALRVIERFGQIITQDAGPWSAQAERDPVQRPE